MYRDRVTNLLDLTASHLISGFGKKKHAHWRLCLHTNSLFPTTFKYTMHLLDICQN